MENQARALETTTNNVRFERMEFRGKETEYSKIFYVNILLTIASLGLYSAWAKVRNKKYLYGATSFQGHSFDYHADPRKILKGRLVAFVVFGTISAVSNISPALMAITTPAIILAAPFIIIQSLKFNFQNTSFKNIRFHHTGRFGAFYKIVAKYLTAPIIFLFVLPPLAVTFLPKAYAPFTILGASVLSLIYFMLVASRFGNDVFKYIYDHLYYGGMKAQLNSTPEKFSQQIIVPFALASFGATIVSVIMTILLGMIGEMGIVVGMILSYAAGFGMTLFLPYLIFNYVWNNLDSDACVSRSDLEFKDFFTIGFTNALLIGLTLGLAYPVAKIRMVRLKTNAKRIRADNLDNIMRMAKEKESALGEELGDFFDLDFDFGL